MTQISRADLVSKHIYFQGESTGKSKRTDLIVHDISPLGEQADWRVSDQELERWLRARGFKPRYQGPGYY